MTLGSVLKAFRPSLKQFRLCRVNFLDAGGMSGFWLREKRDAYRKVVMHNL